MAAAVADFPTHRDSLDTFEGRREGFIYARFGHPTGRGVETRLAAVEGAAERPAGLLFDSVRLLACWRRTSDHLHALVPGDHGRRS